MRIDNPMDTQQGAAQAVHSLYSTHQTNPPQQCCYDSLPKSSHNSCLPDTGCSQTLISADYAKQLKLQINNNNNIQLFSANGGQMQVLGSSRVIMHTISRSIKTEALVTTNLAHPVLLSWHDLIRLNVIDEHFPQTVNSVTTSTRLRILDQIPHSFQRQP